HVLGSVEEKPLVQIEEKSRIVARGIELEEPAVCCRAAWHDDGVRGGLAGRGAGRGGREKQDEDQDTAPGAGDRSSSVAMRKRSRHGIGRPSGNVPVHLLSLRPGE